MTYTERAAKSVNNFRVLFALDITQTNEQWVNHGAGIWVVNSSAIYDWVDSSLLSGLTAQTIPEVGSVLVDDMQLVEASTLLECSDNDGSFYWDGSSLYIHIDGGDSPYIHTVLIGIVFGYSREGFAPVNSPTFYHGRLLGVPSISQSRDPLFWGKLQYEGGSVELNNGDGALDLIGEDYNVYGNQARIWAGFADQDISEYKRLFTGFSETVSVSETGVSLSFKDKRKQLTKSITYTCSAKNALEAIEEILLDNYDIPYNALYYDIDSWETAKPLAESVTIDMQSAESSIEIIQNICQATFGIFIVKANGKYSFKIVRPGNAATFEIPANDIMNNPTASYDPSEVIISTKIGYAKDWTLPEASAYTYLEDTTQEATIYARYKTYNQKEFKTYLPDIAAAQRFSDIILDYAGTIKPTFEIEVPIKYYFVEVGDFGEIEINRATSTWFGTRKCEVIGKTYNLDRNTITFKVKKYGSEIAYRVTTDGEYRFTSDDELRKVGA